ncbi:MAG TPA: serine hydrolase [Xanthobacteraceae bacterium]
MPSVFTSAAAKISVLTLLVGAAASLAAGSARAGSEAILLIDAETGKVLQAENATYPWYPASLSKLMTTYVTLKAVKDGKITFDTLFTVSPMRSRSSPQRWASRPEPRSRSTMR